MTTRRIVAWLCTSAFLMALASTGWGAVIRVALDGSGDFTTVRDACAAVGIGDTLRIAPGEYDEYDGDNARIWVVEKRLTVEGTGTAPSETSLRLSLGIQDPGQTIIRNLRFHDEHQPLYCLGGSVRVENCVFENNARAYYQSDGAALFFGGTFEGSRIVLRDCLFEHNRTLGSEDRGGAVGLAAITVEVTRCRFEENECAGENAGAGAVWDDSDESTYTDCIFWKNRGTRAAALYFEGIGLSVAGCTFAENEVTGPAGGAALEAVGYNTPGVERCIFANTRNGYGMGCWDPVDVRCSDSWGNEEGNYGGWCGVWDSYGDFSENPLFCGQTNGDFRLMEGSPCLPGNHGGVDCGQVGAFGVGCAFSRVQPTTWGRLKLLYR